MRSSNFVVLVACASLSSASVGCNAKPSTAAVAPSGVDEAAVLMRVAGGRYRADGDMLAASTGTYPSQAAPSARVDNYVSSGDAAAYLAISPDRSGSGGGVQPGALLVREVFDGDGQLAKLTLMVKGPSGYNPTVGDFWFGVTQPDGTPVVDSGVTQTGKLTQCYSCHQGRAADGYLFGVPLAMRGHGHGDGGMRGDDDGGVESEDDGGARDGGMHGGHDGGMPHHHHGDMGRGGDVCGDFICGASESCSSCASDCHCCGGGDQHGHTHPCS